MMNDENVMAAEEKGINSPETDNIPSGGVQEKNADTMPDKSLKHPKNAKKNKNVLQKAMDSLDSKRAVSEELKEVKDRLLRLQADFDNFRKRTLREKTELYKTANEDLILELLPVIDHLELALNAANENKNSAEDSFVQGVKLVADQMNTVLGKFGLLPILAEGGEFNHNIHEAVSKLSSAEVPENMIITQVRKGYMYGDKMMRAAQVVVSSGPAENGMPSQGAL